ncbi:hypothetical protein M8C17_13890 [Micromonospora sp. RHAY321]|uniref:hypothetical protein n=1 Tax=Micromonospora sp. RHAY321 TaxID=2944807 RepID=UPI00207D53EA|nr:hypothetical protein [Micromonospora sp. RHAY321]MCO1596249.1 hypothetical protein [Micromonospora sp. RHAY321]
MPDQLFTDMYRDTEHLTWAPTEQVRERGRRRIRRTRVAAVLAGAVAVAVVATGAMALAGGPDAAPTPVLPATGSPTPTPAPSATPTPTPSPPPPTGTDPAAPPSSPSTADGRSTTGSTSPAIPTAALLRASDLPSGYRADGSDMDGDWSFDFAAMYVCADTPTPTAKQRAERGAVFSKPVESTVVERVRRYSADGAKATMDWVRRTVSQCEPDGQRSSLSILDSGFVGDGSLLIRFNAQGVVSHTLFVRQGDLVAEVWLDTLTGQADIRQVAQRVADRLCLGTDSC